MNKRTTTPGTAPPRGAPPAAAGKDASGTADETAPFDLSADIAERGARLIRLYAERMASDDGYQVVDPQTVSSTFQEYAAKAVADPSAIVRAHWEFWGDATRLWQQTAARLLFNTPAEPIISPSPQDKRFKDEAWSENPFFDAIKQHYLLVARYFQTSVGGVEGLDAHTRRKLQFYARHFINALSPTNFPASNPRVIDATVKTRGENLLRGLRNLVGDLERGGGRLSLKMSDSTAFQFGQNIANSPGKVVFQNELMQLIQYAPSTETVHRRPLLIIPPWINKFYIMDLKPKNSFIKWCVDQGNTVFVISWVNPGPELGAKTFSDYLLAGPIAAIDAIEEATGEDEVNLLGYCIGGTLAACTMAYLTARKDRRVRAGTLLTTLLDFSDVGDMSVFIDEKQLDLADQHMQRVGYLEGHHMAEAFNLLRENELIWYFIINNYLMGRDPSAFDLLYWNSDSTRMPANMQSFYLRNMYLKNVLRKPGGVTLANVPIDIGKIARPLYFLSTREDHIAPWRSTYAGTQLVSGPVRFVLGASGHVAGVINPPAANKYGYWTSDALPADPEEWLKAATFHQGSWWADWADWIGGHGGGEVPARQPGSRSLPPIEDAPGSYVRVRAA